MSKFGSCSLEKKVGTYRVETLIDSGLMSGIKANKRTLYISYLKSIDEFYCFSNRCLALKEMSLGSPNEPMTYVLHLDLCPSVSRSVSQLVPFFGQRPWRGQRLMIPHWAISVSPFLRLSFPPPKPQTRPKLGSSHPKSGLPEPQLGLSAPNHAS